MKTIFKFSLAIAAAGIFLSSCGKYEDGPKLSLASKKGRLCREWIDASCSSGCDVTEYKKDGTITTNGTSWSGFTWAFSSDKSKIEYTFTSGSLTSTTSYEITRLTSKDFWVKDSNGVVDKAVAK